MSKSLNVSKSLLKKVGWLLVILVVAFAIFIYESIKESQFAALINYSGKVRGDIQRVVKYYFAQRYDLIPNVEKQIEEYLKYVNLYAESLKLPLVDYGKDFRPVEVEKCFSKLEKLLKQKPTPKVKEEIFNFSEKCWEIADKITNRYQEIAERNFTLLNSFYFLLFLWSILISLLLAKSIVFDINRKLEVRANFDPLTGALNRGAFLEIFNHLSKTPFSYPMGLIVFDLDDFKFINDQFGHSVGDEVLKRVAEAVRKHLRRSDLFVRWGGEEFLVVLPYTDLKGAVKVAEKLRKTIEELKFPIKDLRVTASFGVTELEQGEEFLKAFERADKALYEAKNKGKNRVVVYA